MCFSALVRKDLRKHPELYHIHDYDIDLDIINEHDQTPTIKMVGPDGRFFKDWLAPIVHAAPVHGSAHAATASVASISGAAKSSDRPLFGDEPTPRVLSMARYAVWCPPELDAKNLTTFNARRDNLRSPFWQSAFGQHHGFIALAGFSEWVDVRDLLAAGHISLAEITQRFAEQTEDRRAKILAAGKRYAPTATEKKPIEDRKICIDFTPDGDPPLLVPIIFNERDGRKGFAIVTDPALPEIAAAGHDRTPILLTEEAVSTWLYPKGRTPRQLDAVLDQRINAHFSHRLSTIKPA